MPGFRLTVDLVNTVIALDPEWQGGHYSRNPVEGLPPCRDAVLSWVVSAGYLDRISSHDLAAGLEGMARAFSEWDANALVLALCGIPRHDVSAPFDGDMTTALAKITAPALVLASAKRPAGRDRRARRIADGLKHARYAEIPSDLGHRAVRALPGTPEGDFIDRQIRGFSHAAEGRGE